MATFHPFPRLPFELRAQIWSLTVVSRVVDVRANKPGQRRSPSAQYLASSTPTPASLQTCREARNQGLYQKLFTELAAPDGSGMQYIWLNLAVDVISIGTVPARYYKAVMPVIQHLKLERECSEHWSYIDSGQFWRLKNLKEIHLVCADGLWAWHQHWDRYYWPCGKENVWMIDPDDDRTIRAVEMTDFF